MLSLRKSFVSLFIFLVFVATVNANAAVVCKKDGRWWRPANATAKKIAASLGVKTCNGKRFKAVVAGLGEKSNVKASVKRMNVEDVINAMKSGN